eukprot:SAG31_NODE_1511_length_8060_cov_3.005653_4_plen_122_part_00
MPASVRGDSTLVAVRSLPIFHDDGHFREGNVVVVGIAEQRQRSRMCDERVERAGAGRPRHWFEDGGALKSSRRPPMPTIRPRGDVVGHCTLVEVDLGSWEGLVQQGKTSVLKLSAQGWSCS